VAAQLVRVFLVEDQTLVREGLQSLLTLCSTIELIPHSKPDVVLLTCGCRKKGVEVLQALKAQDALPPTLVLTNSDDDRLPFEALRSGAKGFLLKDVSFEQLTQAIETLSSGGNLIQPALTERAVRSLSESGGAFAVTD
jgi:DNA-binding NarL/FixJ family response regulator